MLDGERVVCDDLGVSDFERLEVCTGARPVAGDLSHFAFYTAKSHKRHWLSRNLATQQSPAICRCAILPVEAREALVVKRRAFITLLGGAAAWPLGSYAQRTGKPVPRVGVLLYGTAETDPNYGSFRRGLRELGYVENENIELEPRFAEGKPERLPVLARELVAAKPDLIYALGGDVAPFVRGATSTIPIVMAVSNDPVQANLVASLQRPGGNITGVTFVSSDLAAKRLQFLHELAPQLARVAVLWNPDHVDPEYRETQAAGKTLGIQVYSLEARSLADFESAYQAALNVGAEAVIPVSSRLMTLDRAGIIAFADRHRLLLASGWGPWAREGALLSYGPDLDEITRRSAAHVDKILRGASPADIPVEQPTRFQLVLNAKRARALGLTIPEKLLALADEVIE
jgi:putative ABC transport system substrate-binding protein